MVKSEGMEVRDLKKELERLLKAILEEDDTEVEVFDRSIQILKNLRDLKFKKTIRKKMDSIDVPENFRCPLSLELMRDPVILSTGETYDRRFIEAWLHTGSRTCPRTLHVISHLILTPNHLVRNMIFQWCMEKGIEPPSYPVHDDFNKEAVTQRERLQFDSLLKKVSCCSSIPEQQQAVKEMRMLTRNAASFRVLAGETPNAISQLLSLLSQTDNEHPDLQEDLVTTLLNISIHDNNKKMLADTPNTIPLLIDALMNGNMETKRNSAAALFSLSALDCNKVKIGESGGIKPLIELLEEGNLLAKKDAASAIFNLCMVHRNKVRAVKDGVVEVLLKLIKDQSLVDESLAILASISSNQHAIDDIVMFDGVSCLVNIIRKKSTNGRNKENSAAILYTVCFNDRMILREMREEENTHQTFSQLAENGTTRARRKATGILDRVKGISSHTA